MKQIGFENRDGRGFNSWVRTYKQANVDVLYVDITVWNSISSPVRYSLTIDEWKEMVEFIKEQVIEHTTSPP